jgi:fibronectin-binding autotransporter adhesin
MNTKSLITGVAAAFAVVGLTVSAHAETNTFQGAANASWATPGSWTLGVPTSAQDVIINNAVAARIVSGTDAVAGTLTIGGASGTTTLEVRPITADTTASLTVAGNLTLSPDAGISRLLMQYNSTLTLNSGSGSIVRGAGGGLAQLNLLNGWSNSLGLTTATVDQLNLASTLNATLTITSGQTYNVSDLVNLNTRAVAGGTSGQINVNGGTLNLGDTTPNGNNNGRLVFNSGNTADNHSTVNLNSGGTLIAKEILRSNTGASAVFNFNDGKIATRSDADLTISATAGTMEISLAEGAGTRTFEAAADRTITVASTALLKDKTGEAGTLTKAGSGTLILSGNNTFSGAVSVQGGLLNLNSTGGASLGSVDSITVNDTATLLISQSHQVNNRAAEVTLSGGTITRASGVSEVFGNLNVSAESFLNFGSGTAGSIEFGTYTRDTGRALLTVQNFFQGNSLVFSQNLVDLGYISSSSAGSFNNGYFAFADGFNTSWNGTDTFTITAIPEPSTCVAAAGLLGLLVFSMRRRAASR